MALAFGFMARMIVAAAAAMFAAASQGSGLHHRQKRAYAGTGRLLTERPSMNRRACPPAHPRSRTELLVLGQGRGDDRRQVVRFPAVDLAEGHRLVVLDLAEQSGEDPPRSKIGRRARVSGTGSRRGRRFVAAVGLAVYCLVADVAKGPRDRLGGGGGRGGGWVGGGGRVSGLGWEGGGGER